MRDREMLEEEAKKENIDTNKQIQSCLEFNNHEKIKFKLIKDFINNLENDDTISVYVDADNGYIGFQIIVNQIRRKTDEELHKEIKFFQESKEASRKVHELAQVKKAEKEKLKQIKKEADEFEIFKRLKKKFENK